MAEKRNIDKELFTTTSRGKGTSIILPYYFIEFRGTKIEHVYKYVIILFNQIKSGEFSDTGFVKTEPLGNKQLELMQIGRH